jgi:effector-binding domain-containing protein
MKALKIIGIIILVLIVLFLVVALFLPSKVNMEESITIKKQASVIYKQVNNFHNWDAWSPFQANDTAMVITYEGPEQGVDAKMSWTSKTSGNGNMVIIESVPYVQVTASLDFGIKGATNSFSLHEEEDGTKVTWGVNIPKLGYPMERYAGALMPKMMAPVFKQGLDKLKEVCEAQPDPVKIVNTDLGERSILYVIDSCSFAETGPKMAQMFGEITAIQKSSKYEQSGAPLAAYKKWDEAKQFTVFECCIPVKAEVPVKGRVQYRVIPAGKAVTAKITGPYSQLYGVYMALDEYVKDFKLEEAGGPMEEYIISPGIEPDSTKWQTVVYFPVK